MGLPSIHQVNILGTALCTFATLVTIWRLTLRHLTHRLWWDDAWAAFSMLNGILIIASVWVIFAPTTNSPGSPDSPSPAPSPNQTARVICFYLLEVCFTFTLWSARMSILWTIIRITPVVTFASSLPNPSEVPSISLGSTSEHVGPVPAFTSGTASPSPHSSSSPSRNAIHKKFGFQVHRGLLYGIAFLFGIFALVLSAQKFWVCIGQRSPIDWAHTPGAFCSLGRQVAILEIVTDIIGDLILVLIPIRLLWSLRLFSRSLHIRLVSVFGMSLVTTAVSLCQNYYQIRDGGVRDFIVSHVETYTAIFICNLNVIAGAIYHWRRGQVEDFNNTGITGSSTSIRFSSSRQSRRNRLSIVSRESGNQSRNRNQNLIGSPLDRDVIRTDEVRSRGTISHLGDKSRVELEGEYGEGSKGAVRWANVVRSTESNRPDTIELPAYMEEGHVYDSQEEHGDSDRGDSWSRGHRNIVDGVGLSQQRGLTDIRGWNGGDSGLG